MVNPKPMVTEGPPRPPPMPAPPLAEVRELGAAWVRDNNAFGPDHKIVADAARQFKEQVKPGEGFLPMLGPKVLKSQKATVLVGWGGAATPLELTPDQARQMSIADAGMVVQTLPASDDDGGEDPLAELSDLRFDRDDSPVGRQFLSGWASFVRLRSDTVFASMRRRRFPAPASGGSCRRRATARSKGPAANGASPGPRRTTGRRGTSRSWRFSKPSSTATPKPGASRSSPATRRPPW